jgi:hypothetical protein
MKTIGSLRKTRYRGRQRVQMHAYRWPPPTTCSESPNSVRLPHEAELEPYSGMPSAGDGHRPSQLNPTAPTLQNLWK